jgi:Holliday junction resolvase RusA-like endonuclease
VRILIPDFPFPPSSNQLRGSFFDRDKRKMRHYDTAIYKAYKSSCEAWAWKEFKNLRNVKPALQSYLKDHQTVLSIATYFVFRHENLWTREGKLQEVDTSNRIKACHDELAKHLGIDDRYFNIKAAEKVWVLDHEEERVIVEITISKLRKLAEVESSLLQSR